MKWLVRLVVLALVPVLFVAAEQLPAAATVTTGSEASTSFDINNVLVQRPDEIKCDLQYRWATIPGEGPGITAPSSYFQWTAQCATGWDVSRADIVFSFDGHDGAAECHTATLSHQYDGHPNGAGSTTPPIVGYLVLTTPEATGCTIEHVCMTADWDSHSSFGGSPTVCNDATDDADPGAAPVPWLPSGPGTCTAMTATPPEQVSVAVPHGWIDNVVGGPVPTNYKVWSWAEGWRYQVTATGSIGSHSKVYMYVVEQADDSVAGTSYTVTDHDSPGDSNTGKDAATGSLTPSTSRHLIISYHTVTYTPGANIDYTNLWPEGASINRSIGGVYPPIRSGHVIGVGLIGNWSGTDAQGSFTTNTPTPTDLRGRVGITDTSLCQFYWGEQILDPSVTGSTPTSGLPTVDPGDPPPLDCDGDYSGDEDPPAGCDGPDEGTNNECGFSFTDPSTWATAGFCELVKGITRMVGLLGEIVNLLTNLAADIASAIGGAVADAISAAFGTLGGILQGLFVPDRDHFTDEVDDVKDAWSDTPPGTVLETVGTLPGELSAPAGSCDGPEWDVDLPFDGGRTLALHPLSTCAEGVARVALVVKTALQVGVWLGALMLALRVLAGSIGYDVKLGRGGDDE